MNAFGVLGLSPGATSAEVKARYRDLARTLHPDAGGDAAEFSKVAQAYREALAEATVREATCPACGGSGRRNVTSRGFQQASVLCQSCHGSGRSEGA